MTRRRRDPEEVLASRAADVALLRLVDEAKRRGLAGQALVMIERAKLAEFRQRGAVGVEVRRRRG